jgi:hypothetical protein
MPGGPQAKKGRKTALMPIYVPAPRNRPGMPAQLPRRRRRARTAPGCPWPPRAVGSSWNSIKDDVGCEWSHAVIAQYGQSDPRLSALTAGPSRPEGTHPSFALVNAGEFAATL